jgi:hypothetical protein
MPGKKKAFNQFSFFLAEKSLKQNINDKRQTCHWLTSFLFAMSTVNFELQRFYLFEFF